MNLRVAAATASPGMQTPPFAPPYARAPRDGRPPPRALPPAPCWRGGRPPPRTEGGAPFGVPREGTPPPSPPIPVGTGGRRSVQAGLDRALDLEDGRFASRDPDDL